MRVQLLGAHQGESINMRFMSLLIDDRLAIDAGGLTSSTTIEPQLGIEAILITHRHYDHIKDLPMLAHNIWETKSLEIYSTADTAYMIQKHLFNDEVWPAMREDDLPYHRIIYHIVEPDKVFNLLGYEVLPMTMPHTVPTIGYYVQRDGKGLFYTADTRGDGNPPWVSIRPDLLVVETTMSNEFDKDAMRFGHMTPV